MTSLTVFSLAAALLVVVVLAIMLPPLWRKPKPLNAADRQETNLEIFRDQLSELERDRSDGSLADADYEQAKSELQRRLLEEVQPESVVPETSGGRKTALALLIAIPLAALAGYALLGKPQALDALPTHAQARMNPQQFDEMIGKLVAKLKANPDDSKGWVTLARSYKSLGRFDEAAEAYSHAGSVVDSDPSLLADYAETLVQMNGGNFEGKPDQLISRALKIDPDAPLALFLAGAAATDRNDFAAVVTHWGRLLPQLEPGTEDALSIGAAVDKAREIVKQSGGKPFKPAAASAETISGEVSLSGKLIAQAKPEDLLFVFARSGEGSRMPLAAMKAKVADLPLSFRFDDSMALQGGKKISEFKTVSVEARIAKAGTAQSSSGDLFGSLNGIKPGSKNLKLVIDKVQP